MSAAEAEERAVMLRDFQNCTGIDDVSVALDFLEECGWNLMSAVHRVLPEDTESLPLSSPQQHHRPAPAAAPTGDTEDKELLDIDSESDTHTTTFGIGSLTNNKMSKKAASANDFPIPRQSGTTNSHSNHSSNHGFSVPQNSQSLQTVPTGRPAAPSGSNDRKVVDMDSDSDVEDLTETYQDDEFLIPEVNGGGGKAHQRFLITDNVEDEDTGTILFSESFTNRYGHCHPMFFHGTLDAAIREATLRPAKDRKLLALYLHHDDSVLSNIFCTQILCTEAIVNLLSINFVTWGWDVTHESNRQMLLTSANKSFGPPGVSAIRQIEKDRYPVIIVVSRVRAATEICDIIYGTNGVDDIMSRLLHVLEIFRTQQSTDVREEEEREARERVIQEQNEAYQESLRADIAKEEAKKASELQKKREEDEKMAALAFADAQRRSVLDTLPSEPGPGCTEPICVLRCRFPNGKIGSRKFLQSTKLKILFDYLFSEGFSKDEYKILFSHPKRDLTEFHQEEDLIGKVFSAQDTLILEER